MQNSLTLTDKKAFAHTIQEYVKQFGLYLDYKGLNGPSQQNKKRNEFENCKICTALPISLWPTFQCIYKTHFDGKLILQNVHRD